MSQDIRNFFTVLSKKPSQPNIENHVKVPNKQKSKKSIDKSVVIDSDVDIVEPTPEKNKKLVSKKRKIQVLSSDSEDDTSKPQPTQEKSKNNISKLKPVDSLKSFFGDAPVKQTKVVPVSKPEKINPPKEKERKPKNKKQKVNTELGVHNDEAFEKTLLDLDEDILTENLDALDKSVNEALARESSPTKSNITEKTPSRKRKISENESGINSDEERHEKRRQSAILYQKYLNRGEPPLRGTKELPEGKPDCLKNLCFIRTGVLDSLDSTDFEELVKKHGGRIVHAVSKKVNYVVAGTEPGPAKLEKAEQYGIPTISEDDLLDLIRTKSGMKPIYTKQVNKDAEEEPSIKIKHSPPKSSKASTETTSNKSKECKPKTEVKKSPAKEKNKPAKSDTQSKRSPTKSFETIPNSTQRKPAIDIKKLSNAASNKTSSKYTEEIPAITHRSSESSVNLKKHSTSSKLLPSVPVQPLTRTFVDVPNSNMAWTEKYKPKNTKAIIGQQGDKSNLHKLITWLQNWHKHHSGKSNTKLARPSPWAKNDDGAYFKCALLSGPPGVGKTTTATLVAEELGFDVVEFNASDTRSKKLLHEQVAQLLSTSTLAGFAIHGTQTSNKRVLLMDEVDGMAGNEDRGGIQELIALIKNTNVPIICMCNDRQHPKVRSLANYCFDLRFSKPRVEQIRGAMMTICHKEGIKISPDALIDLINGTGMDMRQCINNLFMWSSGNKTLQTSEVQKEATSAKKDTVLGPWEVIRQVFSETDHKNMSIVDRVRLFFYDYSIGPLFVQENYLKVVPHAPKNELLKRVADTADSISLGDIIDAKIRSSNNWSLLETQGMFASVLPGHYMQGHVGGQINFPSWLGKNSKRGKFRRILSELHMHTRMSTSGNRTAINLDYLQYIRNKIVNPLVKNSTDGVEEALDAMNSYHLLREDLDNIIEVSHWPGHKNVMSAIDSKVKAAFTRAYNKNSASLPYAVASGSLKKRIPTSHDEDLHGEDENGELGSENDEDDDDINKDSMIKAKNKTSTPKSSKTEEKKKPSTSKGRGKKK